MRQPSFSLFVRRYYRHPGGMHATEPSYRPYLDRGNGSLVAILHAPASLLVAGRRERSSNRRTAVDEIDKTAC
jgi:hypothetical protein